MAVSRIIDPPMSHLLQNLLAPLSFGTRFRGPSKPSDPRVYSRALAFQPLIGFLIGAVAAVLPLFMAVYFRGVQGFMLFASGVYLFLLEWLTRFDHLHGFDAACRALAGFGVSPEERLARLGQPGSSPCTAILFALKLLLLYLIFMRTALFGDNMLLAIVLVAVPFFGRTVMLFSYPSERTGDSSAGGIGSVGGAVKLFWTLTTLLLLAIALGMLRVYGGDFFSFRTMKLTMSGFGDGGLPPLFALISLGIEDTGSFLVSGFLTMLYWNTEAEKKLKMRPAPCFAGAVCETAELAAMIIFLILCDELIF